MNRWKYILKNGVPVPCDDTIEWGTWLEKADRRVALDDTPSGRVSTVFLGIDHNFSFGGPPLLFETMVFGGPFDGEQNRYSTREEALKGHAKILKKVKAINPGRAITLDDGDKS